MKQSSWDIKFTDLTIGYGNTVVLENINATLPAGKISVILGGSGCGKSTLLRHIIGLSRPMSGSINVGGVNMCTAPQKEFRSVKRHMGVLFQDGALLGSLTVGENVGLSLKEHTRLSTEEIREIAIHNLSLVGLSDVVDYYPAELSGGMRKRVGLARALVTTPPILLCDEPTSGLDPISAAQMDELLLTMKEHFPEMTIVIVSHDLSSLKVVADHVLVLNDRKDIFSGSLTELESSGNPYLRRFLDRKASDSKDSKKEKSIGISAKTKALFTQEITSWFKQ